MNKSEEKAYKEVLALMDIVYDGAFNGKTYPSNYDPERRTRIINAKPETVPGIRSAVWNWLCYKDVNNECVLRYAPDKNVIEIIDYGQQLWESAGENMCWMLIAEVWKHAFIQELKKKFQPSQLPPAKPWSYYLSRFNHVGNIATLNGIKMELDVKSIKKVINEQTRTEASNAEVPCLELCKLLPLQVFESCPLWWYKQGEEWRVGSNPSGDEQYPAPTRGWLEERLELGGPVYDKPTKKENPQYPPLYGLTVVPRWKDGKTLWHAGLMQLSTEDGKYTMNCEDQESANTAIEAVTLLYMSILSRRTFQAGDPIQNSKATIIWK